MLDKTIDLSFCIDALRGSMMLRGQALQIELAVGLYAFQAIGATDINAKKTLRGIYASAGEADCIEPGSDSYQTVSRRIGYIAGLHDNLRPKVIKKWIAGKSGQDSIDAIIEQLKPYGFTAMDNVRIFITSALSKPVTIATDAEQAAPEPQHRRATDAPGTVHVKTEHIDLPIPPDATKDELMDLAMQIMALAKKGVTNEN